MQTLKTGENAIALSGLASQPSPVSLHDPQARIAVLLRSLRQSQKLSLFQFCPSTVDTTSSLIVRATARELLRMGERPLLILDMNQQTATQKSPEFWEDRGSSQFVRIPSSVDLSSESANSPLIVARFSGESGGAQATPDNVAAFLLRARSRFAFTLVDTPCVLGSAEGLMTGGLADGVILTVAAGKTKVSEVKQSKELIERNNGRVLGFVQDETPLTALGRRNPVQG